MGGITFYSRTIINERFSFKDFFIIHSFSRRFEKFHLSPERWNMLFANVAAGFLMIFLPVNSFLLPLFPSSSVKTRIKAESSGSSLSSHRYYLSSFTSGMMTSKQSYGYGSFQFQLKIESERKGINLPWLCTLV